MTTPTPPADTRQQAAEKGPLYDDLKQRMETLHVRWARHAARQTKTARETGYWDAVEACRIELRDVLACYPASSPALPEPPAPAEVTRDELVRYFAESSPMTAVSGFAEAWADHLLQRFRLTPLLVAADVAEEQQP